MVSMVGVWFSQYRLVVGKNFKLKKRSKCGTCVECLFPIIVIIVLIGFMRMYDSLVAAQVITNFLNRGTLAK